MLHLSDMKLISKIAIPVAILGIVSIGLVGLSVWSISRLADNTQHIINGPAERRALLIEITSLVNESVIQSKNALLDSRPEAIAEFRQKYDAITAKIDNQLDALLAISDTPEIKASSEKDRDAVQKVLGFTDESLKAAEARNYAAAILISNGDGRIARTEANTVLSEHAAVLGAELEADTRDAATLASQIDATLVVSAIIGLLGSAALLGWIALRHVTRPLGVITSQMSRLAAGDLDIRIERTTQRDEIGQLARALSTFRENAIAMRDRADNDARESALKMARAERLAAVSEEFERAVSGLTQALSSAATEMEATASSMSSVATETAHSANTVASTATQTAANVDAAADATGELAGSIREIAAKVAHSTGIAGKAVAGAGSAQGKVLELAGAAERVGAVVDLISSIAEQTNLLALNATIEAARAGEAGRGFAVVAGEVKNLATQTAKATADISDQIAAMRASTNDVVQAIGSIGAVIDEMSGISNTIAGAIDEQERSASLILDNVRQAATATTAMTAAISNVGAHAGDTGAAAGNVLTASRELSRYSVDLRREVEGFLVSIKAA